MIPETEPFSNMSAGKDVDIKAFEDFITFSHSSVPYISQLNTFK